MYPLVQEMHTGGRHNSFGQFGSSPICLRGHFADFPFLRQFADFPFLRQFVDFPLLGQFADFRFLGQFLPLHSSILCLLQRLLLS